ncbi:hypothetical protein FACS189487_05420 [Campylobacterota bacterium]|nr:hypothetical protein FACS189487_05420 [Campylobacterota bacterium]
MMKGQSQNKENATEETTGDQQQENTIRNEFVNEKGEIDYGLLGQRQREILEGKSWIRRLHKREEVGRTRAGATAIEASLILRRTEERKREVGTAGQESTNVRSRDDVQKEDRKLIEKYARERGAWTEASEIATWSKVGSGKESTVYKKSSDQNFVYKVFDVHNKNIMSILDDRVALYNYRYPKTAYEVFGVTSVNGQ